MAVIIVFGIVLLVCAAEVIRLARDARADLDRDPSEQDVFGRRWTAVRQRITVDSRLGGRLGNSRDLPTIPVLPRR